MITRLGVFTSGGKKTPCDMVWDARRLANGFWCYLECLWQKGSILSRNASFTLEKYQKICCLFALK